MKDTKTKVRFKDGRYSELDLYLFGTPDTGGPIATLAQRADFVIGPCHLFPDDFNPFLTGIYAYNEKIGTVDDLELGEQSPD